jgi:hypothetical protein
MTGDSFVTGSGRLDLRDGRIDLRLAPEHRRFTLFSRQSDVRLTGTLAAPRLVPEQRPWLRPASFLGLRLTLPDLGAIFDFVDPGSAAPLSCAAIRPGGRIIAPPLAGGPPASTGRP